MICVRCTFPTVFIRFGRSLHFCTFRGGRCTARTGTKIEFWCSWWFMPSRMLLGFGILDIISCFFIWTLNNGMNGIPLEICFFWWMILLSWWIFLAASNEIAGGKNPYFMSMLVDSPGDAPPQKENTYITRTSRTKKAPVHHSYDHILLNRIFSFLFESWNMDKRDQCIQIIQHFPNEFCC